jgi:hypothetical protein
MEESKPIELPHRIGHEFNIKQEQWTIGKSNKGE